MWLAGERVKLNLTGIDQIQVNGDRDRLKAGHAQPGGNAIQYTPGGGQVNIQPGAGGKPGLLQGQ